MSIDYALFKQAIGMVRAALKIKGCIVLNFTAYGLDQFPLWDKAPGIKGILPIWHNDNDILGR